MPFAVFIGAMQNVAISKAAQRIGKMGHLLSELRSSNDSMGSEFPFRLALDCNRCAPCEFLEAFLFFGNMFRSLLNWEAMKSVMQKVFGRANKRCSLWPIEGHDESGFF